MMFYFIFIVLVSTHACQQNSTLPAVVSTAVICGTASGVCPSAEVIEAESIRSQ